ncbi:MAG: RluA family pseudouridine synthase [Fastidiosipilaceae bacterium]
MILPDQPQNDESIGEDEDHFVFVYPGLNDPIVILYEDNQVIAAIKPAGVLSQQDHTGKPDMLTILKTYIKEKYNKPGNVFLGLVHRLDQPVRGVMVFARTSKSASRLSEQIRTRTVEKEYLAVVSGRPPQSNGVLKNALKKDRAANRVQVSSKSAGGRMAVLRYQHIGSSREGGLSLLRIELETGRAHQIRVQLAEAGCPIWGDQRYNETARHGQPIALLAHRYSFWHPTRKTRLDITAPLEDVPPWDQFEDLIKQHIHCEKG